MAGPTIADVLERLNEVHAEVREMRAVCQLRGKTVDELKKTTWGNDGKGLRREMDDVQRKTRAMLWLSGVVVIAALGGLARFIVSTLH